MPQTPQVAEQNGQASRVCDGPRPAGQRACRLRPGGLRPASIRAASAAPNGATTAISCGPWVPALVVANSTMLPTMATARTWSTRAAPAKNRQATSSSARPTRARLTQWSSAV